MRLAFGSSLCVSLIGLACARSSQVTSSADDFRRAVSGAEWQLTELDGQPAPTGAGNKLTLFDGSAPVARFTREP